MQSVTALYACHSVESFASCFSLDALHKSQRWISRGCVQMEKMIAREKASLKSGSGHDATDTASASVERPASDKSDL